MEPVLPDPYLAKLASARANFERRSLAEAEAACIAALELRPGEPNGLAILAMILIEAGRLVEAEAAVQAAWRSAPRLTRIGNLAAAVALRQGKGATARDICLAVLQQDRFDQRALGDLGLAAVLLDDVPTVSRLLNLDLLARVSRPSPPPDFESIGAFNAQLCRAICDHPGLDRSGTAKTLVGGGRLPDAFDLAPALRSGLRAMFTQAADDYAANTAIKLAADHPVVVGRPEAFSLVSWANVLEGEGHETAHIHEGAGSAASTTPPCRRPLWKRRKRARSCSAVITSAKACRRGRNAPSCLIPASWSCFHPISVIRPRLSAVPDVG